MPYFAQIENNQVARVIVCADIAWLETNLGGTWVETKIGDAVEYYAGPGMFTEADHPVKFAREWVQPLGSEDAYPIESYVWLNDRIYQSTTPANIWSPLVFGWRDKTDLIPRWRQPLGAGDVWNLNDEVLHNDKHWRSNIANNVWEPGAVGITQWDDITETEPPADIPDWVPWTSGLNGDLHQIGDVVKHAGKTWIATIGNNFWEPGVFGWTEQV